MSDGPMAPGPPAPVLLLTDPAMGEHAAPGHPERPERLAPVVAGVEEGARRAGMPLARQSVRPADDEALLRVHAPWYVEALEAAAKSGGGWLDSDTYLVDGSVHAARLAAGATVAAALAVARREARVAFAAVRPPGHHASAERGTGFCLINSVAVAVEALRAEGLARRIAIVDWDVHHGDGTQSIFDADPDLCYASSHQSPLYPGTGSPAERGQGAAVGTKHNRPLAPGSGDGAFVEAWREDLLPAVEAFRPEAILVSAGYDAHRDDPLAELRVTEAGFEMVARLVAGTVTRLSLPGLALTLEGGYDLDALRASSAATIVGLLAQAGEEGPE
jgi:acetoin utilization deacetylase AcuC-like enzyme